MIIKQFKYLENESNIDVLVLNIVLIPNLYIDEVDILFKLDDFTLTNKFIEKDKIK